MKQNDVDEIKAELREMSRLLRTDVEYLRSNKETERRLRDLENLTRGMYSREHISMLTKTVFELDKKLMAIGKLCSE